MLKKLKIYHLGLGDTTMDLGNMSVFKLWRNSLCLLRTEVDFISYMEGIFHTKKENNNLISLSLSIGTLLCHLYKL